MLNALIHHRYRTVLAAAAIILILEVAEHFLLLRYGLRAHQIFDVILYALLLPALTWIALTELARAERERNQADTSMNLHTGLSQRLGEAQNWEALVESIVTFSRDIAPQASARLYIYHDHQEPPKLEASYSRDGVIRLNPPLPAPDGASAVGVNHPDRPSEHGQAVDPALSPHLYEQPITRGDQKLAVLQLEYPFGIAPSPTEQRALKNAAPIIALALEGTRLKKLAAEQAAASEADRQQIAQNLHDTLAQNIGYLRLKLDQLTSENNVREISVVLQELERMRATADEAYAQVRRTLDELAPLQTEDLVTSVVKQARTICDRAGLKLRTSQIGTHYPLPGTVRRQILYIAREALHNIEKHALASQVHVQFLWLEAEMILKISDDGAGFNPLLVPLEGHYGLWIMQQRADDLGGALKINPSDEKGTEVTLWVPRPAHPNSAAEKP